MHSRFRVPVPKAELQRPHSQTCKMASVCVVKIGENYKYQIPSFPVIVVNLRHAVIQTCDDDDDTVKLSDIFFREDCLLSVITPFSVKVIDTCFIDVSCIIIL